MDIIYKIKIKSLILLFSLCLYACDENDSYLSLSDEIVTVNAAGGKNKIEIYSNTKWNISNKADWISIDNTTGMGEDSLTLQIETNITGEDRSTELIITAEKLIKTLTIEQTGAYLTLNTKEIIFDAQGTPELLQIESNYKWIIYKSENLEWCDIDIESGEGDNIVVLTPLPTKERILREESTLLITCFNLKTEIKISQEFFNSAPSNPSLISPQNNSNGQPVNPVFRWDPSIDRDGDIVYYQLYISTDRENWTSFEEETMETFTELEKDILDGNTFYYWKIRARDNFGGESESEILTFTTGEANLYSDGEVLVYRSSTSGYNPVHLVILGEGFVKADYLKGGAFDLAAETAIEAFLSVEPYPTYREYFTVYKIAGYSQERGATVKANFTYSNVKKQSKNTLFNSVLEGGGSTGISCDHEKVFEYIQKIPVITERELRNTTIILIINLEVYAGTCMISTSGQSIAMCPVGSTFEEIVTHEAGGHGFAKLLDEYIYYENQTFPNKNGIEIQRSWAGGVWSWGANVDFTNDESSVHWNHYFSNPDYAGTVGLFEGAYMYGKGIWRPEYNSCMNNNIPYYNAPSREAIVRRIMTISGKGFNRNEFYEKDHPRNYTGGAKMLPREDFRPLAPPIIMEH